jgi:hypothetical protein
MENKEKLYRIRYGTDKDDYIIRYLKEEEIIDGCLSESKAFDLFFDAMIMCNNYFDDRLDDINYLVSSYDDEKDTWEEEYQFFIVSLIYDEDLTIKAIKKMNNTLYYDEKLDLYIVGITDFGTSRTIVPTDLEVYEVTE